MDQKITGVLVAVNGNALTLLRNGSRGMHSVAPGALITLNGAACSLGDLKPNDQITLDGNPVKQCACDSDMTGR